MNYLKQKISEQIKYQFVQIKKFSGNTKNISQLSLFIFEFYRIYYFHNIFSIFIKNNY